MRNRALIDGNKRFGRLATVVLQGLNGIRLETTMFQLVIGACFSAGRQLSIRRGLLQRYGQHRSCRQTYLMPIALQR